MIKYKAQEVGEDANMILPLPKSVLDYLGWKDGEDLVIDVPVSHKDTLLIHKNETPKFLRTP